MKQRTIIVIFLFIVSFYSCKKDIEKNNLDSMSADPNLSFLINAVSDSCNENDFYIKGEFNGRKLCFKSTGRTNSDFGDTIMNAYYIYHYDYVKKDSMTNNLYLARHNSDNSIWIALYCGQTHIQTRTFPYSQPNPNLEHCEFSELQLVNYNHQYSSGQNSAQNNYVFSNHTGFGVNLTFTSCTPDNIVQGNFEGTLKTESGSFLKVTEGKFRIKFLVSEINLH